MSATREMVGWDPNHVAQQIREYERMLEYERMMVLYMELDKEYCFEDLWDSQRVCEFSNDEESRRALEAIWETQRHIEGFDSEILEGFAIRMSRLCSLTIFSLPEELTAEDIHGMTVPLENIFIMDEYMEQETGKHRRDQRHRDRFGDAKVAKRNELYVN